MRGRVRVGVAARERATRERVVREGARREGDGWAGGRGRGEGSHLLDGGQRQLIQRRHVRRQLVIIELGNLHDALVRGHLDVLAFRLRPFAHRLHDVVALVLDLEVGLDELERIEKRLCAREPHLLVCLVLAHPLDHRREDQVGLRLERRRINLLAHEAKRLERALLEEVVACGGNVVDEPLDELRPRVLRQLNHADRRHDLCRRVTRRALRARKRA